MTVMEFESRSIVFQSPTTHRILYARLVFGEILNIDLVRHEQDMAPATPLPEAPLRAKHTPECDQFILDFFEQHCGENLWAAAIALGGEPAGYTDIWVLCRFLYLVDMMNGVGQNGDDNDTAAPEPAFLEDVQNLKLVQTSLELLTVKVEDEVEENEDEEMEENEERIVMMVVPPPPCSPPPPPPLTPPNPNLVGDEASTRAKTPEPDKPRRRKTRSQKRPKKLPKALSKEATEQIQRHRADRVGHLNSIPNFPPLNSRRIWTRDQDAQILAYVNSLGWNWRMIARVMGGRHEGFSDDSIRNRFLRLTGLKTTGGRYDRATPKRGVKWEQHEDAIILHAFEEARVYAEAHGDVESNHKTNGVSFKGLVHRFTDRTAAAIRLRAQRLGCFEYLPSAKSPPPMSYGEVTGE